MNIDTENGEPVIIDIEYGNRIQMSTLSEIGVQMPSVPSRNESPADQSFVYAMSFKDQMTNAIADKKPPVLGTSVECACHFSISYV